MSAVTSANADPEGTQDRVRLAETVRARRLELGLSVRAAAEQASLARTTWIGLEDASRRTTETAYAGIERTLRWAPGSMNRILQGGQPEPLPAKERPAKQETASDSDEALIRVMRSPDLTDAQKAKIVRTLIAEQERARRRILEMVDEMIAETRSYPPNLGTISTDSGRNFQEP